MVDIDTKSGIEYGRGVVKTVLTRDVFAADTDRGDKVALDGRWEVIDAP